MSKEKKARKNVKKSRWEMSYQQLQLMTKIKHRLKKAGTNLTAFAKELGTDHSTARRYLTGQVKSEFGDEVVAKILEKAGMKKIPAKTKQS